ncbi:GH92 family glycosyl hydrolase [Archangium lipolyticum]|uniref:GH92 family glycosyl hydrolase n=1 Tax=Archangium lipolyticum TaxID=2970465 RepID=UPI00214A83D6|nr:GH92 family glycosyl hydrolase [Archangium lipolyticum]
MKQRHLARAARRFALCAWSALVFAGAARAAEPAAHVNPFIGTTNGGNVFPGAVLPFGMAAFSPEQTPLPGRRFPIAAPGGYEWRSIGIKGFSLTHVSGTGCTGASGDIPLMPITTEVSTSPALDYAFTAYSSLFSHADEEASPGYYAVKLGNGVKAELSATLRTAAGRFTYPPDRPAHLLIRTSDSQIGSSDAQVKVDPEHRTVSGQVTSGNFCGYLAPDRHESYYTLYFVAEFDQPFTAGGTWVDGELKPGSTEARGGTTYGERGHPPGGKGSGAWIRFDSSKTPVVGVRVGISYVSEENARANLRAENPAGTSFDTVRQAARRAWNDRLGQIRITGGTEDERTVFYTALYHSLLHPNVYSDVDGRYRGFDQQVHQVSGQQKAQYANFSGWDVYRSQVQLVTWLDPRIGADIAQSLLNQAQQNGGVWDRWTHNTGATGVMNGDPSPPSVAAIAAFGGTGFDLKGAYVSLLKAATVPTAKDLSKKGCPVLCVGQRPGLDQWLKLHYMPVDAPGWGMASDTLEMVAADFGVAELARRAGDTRNFRRFRERAGWWRNLFNPKATPEGGYIQPRNADGTWPAFKPEQDDGFVEGSGAQYVWMVPFDAQGLFDAMGGTDKAVARLDRFFRKEDGSWAVTKSGPLHAELDNEPSIAAPWLYAFAGQPWKTQAVVREAMRRIWTNKPEGISGNDDLGQMSSWYVWSALGMYPVIPGRAELVLGSPLFPEAVITRPGGTLTIRAPGAAMDSPYVTALKVNGKASTRPWLPESFALAGGTLDFTLSKTPDERWGSAREDAPPSFGPKSR